MRHSRGAAILAVAAASTLSWCFAPAGQLQAAELPDAAPPSLAWHHVATTANPPARSGAAVTYDAASGYLLLFGGTGAGGHVLDDTWSFNGTRWTQLQPDQSPPALTGATMAYDATLHQLLLFGGSTTAGTPTPQSATYAWNGASWSLIATTGPSARTQATLTNVESGSGSFVLFGGLGAATKTAPTTTTTTTPTTTPPSSSTTALSHADTTTQSAAAGDTSSSSTGAAVTSAASPSGITALDDTWVWNGQTWSQVTASGPPARADATATWDPARHQVVLVGGSTDGSGSAGALRADQWTWDGVRWASLHTKTAPPARAGATLTADAAAGGDVLVAGQESRGPAADAWLLRDGVWSPLHPGGTLPARAEAGAVWDSANSQLVVTGGVGPGATPLADTYALTPAAPATTPSTTVPHPKTTTVPTPPTTAVPGKGTSTVPSTSTTIPSTLVTSPPTTASHPRGHASIVATPSSTTAPPAAQPPLVAAPHTLHPGEQIVVSGAGYEPGAQVTITFHSTPVRLGAIQTDATGHFSAEVTVPADTAAGAHHVVAEGQYHNGKLESFSVPVEVTLPGPGGNSHLRTAVLMLVAFGVPVLTWVAMAVGSRRKRRAEAA